MGERLMTTAERGYFKEIINVALFKNDNIKELLLGDTTDMTNDMIKQGFKDRVFSHLFVDDTIEETETYIFYDVIFPEISTHIKDCRLLIYLVCSRDILDNYHAEGYYGNRVDILSQMIEDTLLNDKDIANSFGIGELDLDSIEIYNSRRFYGCVMTFSVPNFRWKN